MAEVSKLPSAMQGKKQELESAADTPPADTPPADTPPADTPPAEGRVTISRKEFNDLQAAADRVKTAEGRADTLRDDLEALQMRLTELERGPKDEPNGDPPAPSPLGSGLDLEPVALTDKETEDFEEDAIAIMHKIATNAVRKELARVIPVIQESISSVEATAKNAVSTVGKVATNGFTDRVRAEVASFSDFDSLVNHENWKDFLEGVEPLSGSTYAEILTKNIQRENKESVVRIFRMFYDKYLKEDTPTRPDGYSGVDPSRAVDVDTNVPAGGRKEMLPISTRRAAHKKFINKQISTEEYEKVKADYDKADSEGRVDYTK